MKSYYEHEFTKGELIANAVSHGVGVFIAIAGLVLLVVFSAIKGNAWHVVSSAIFGSAMVLVFLSSTFNHSFLNGKAHEVFHILDKSAIYLMIAGTYTPFSLVALHGALGWVVFGVEWGFAILGIVAQSVFGKKYEKQLGVICVIIYIIMGWFAIAFIKPLLQVMTWGGIVFLFGGGVCYTLGVVFFAWRKLRYHHLVWHILVIAGAVMHFFSIFFYVIP
ncbi:MAG: hemolysin III family protein, partial [bacterium]|nr:hemolysin III family protein [bacterium]